MYFNILQKFEEYFLNNKELKTGDFIDIYPSLSKALKEYYPVKWEKTNVGLGNLGRGLANQPFIHPEIKAQITSDFIEDLFKCLKEMPIYYEGLALQVPLFKKCILEKYNLHEKQETLGKPKPLTKDQIKNKCKALIKEKVLEYLKLEAFKEGGFKSELYQEIKGNIHSTLFTENLFNEVWKEIMDENPDYKKILSKRGRRYDKEAS